MEKFDNGKTEAMPKLVRGVALSPIVVVAALSIVALLVASVWQATNYWKSPKAVSNTEGAVAVSSPAYVAPKSVFDWQKALEEPTTDTEVASDPDGLANIGKNVVGALAGSYVALSDSGLYSPEQGKVIAETVAEDLRADVSYTVYGASDVKTDPATSYSRMMTYRNDMRVAFEPLLENTRYELEIFGYYLETKDQRYLDELKQQAAYYEAAKQNILNVVAPADAVRYHVDVLNALSQFGAVLTRLTQHVNDPFASAALLRTFNDSEARMFLSFDALAKYYREYPQS